MGSGANRWTDAGVVVLLAVAWACSTSNERTGRVDSSAGAEGSSGGEDGDGGGAASDGGTSGEPGAAGVKGANEVGAGRGGGPGGSDEPAPTDDAGIPFPEGSLGCQDFDVEELRFVAQDANCDGETPRACPEGTHIDFDEMEPCAVCAPDTPDNRTCGWARGCFAPFVQYLAHASGAMACSVDTDCSVDHVAVPCASAVTIALRSLLDEELHEAAELYARDNCDDCSPETDAEPPPETPQARCVEGRCLLADPE